MQEYVVRYAILAFFAFVAEIFDGGIGMGYGVSLTSFLLSIGAGTAVASASVHLSEIGTTLISGVSHWKMGNFDKKIFCFLAIPGILGGILGAAFSVYFEKMLLIKPVISAILLVLGIAIIVKFLKKRGSDSGIYKSPRIRQLVPLGFIAAFVDAIGGGGWGPIATPALVISDAHPKKTIGSVNFAEFVVTVSISLTFLFTLKQVDWGIVLPMIVGGFIAAPSAAFITRKIDHKVLGIGVGILISFLSVRTILIALGIGFIF
ncbi:MAG: sulfite exporter TauE/SafE family protein [Patescibacteria group bacterium]